MEVERIADYFAHRRPQLARSDWQGHRVYPGAVPSAPVDQAREAVPVTLSVTFQADRRPRLVTFA
jgi:hypothetical protein